MKTLEIYCDGSAKQEQIGCGIVFVSDNEIVKEFSYKFPFNGSICHAEYLAIIYALYMVDFYVESLYIYTDNYNFVLNYMGDSLNPSCTAEQSKLSLVVRNLANNLNCKHFKLNYVKSHAKNIYHNRADELARKSLGI